MPRGMNSPRETTPMQAKCIKLDLILDQVVIIQFHVYFHPAVGSHWSSSALLSRMRCVHCLRLLKPADMIVLPGRRSLRQIWLGASRGLLLSGIAVKMSKPTNAAEAPPLHTPRVVQVGCFIFQFLKYWLLQGVLLGYCWSYASLASTRNYGWMSLKTQTVDWWKSDK